MRIADALRGIQRLAIDTAPYIYFVENRADYADKVSAIFRHIEQADIQIATSVIALTECLTKPLESADQRLVAVYQQMLTGTAYVRLVPVSETLAVLAASLRARYRLRTPDAIHMASAIESGSEAFLTNDHELRRVVEIRVLTLDELEIET